MSMRIRNILIAGLFATVGAYSAQAAVSASEAQQLGTTLTQFGAQKTGSADGAIPAYTGGIAAMTGLPAGNPTTGYPNPFAGEKALFSITSANMAQYADQLTPGVQALLQRYPDFRIDVYPTHRTASYPAWVLQNTLKNATSAQMDGEGDGVTGAYGGIPFPIPQDGNEVMWNSFLSYHPASCMETYQNYLVDASGNVTDLGTLEQDWVEPYYDPTATALNGKFWQMIKFRYYTPASQAGEMFLFEYPINFTVTDDVTWFYSPGTRRVRLAPEFKYDTPAASYGGTLDYDEIGMFYGQMNKFDFRLTGSKEMIVPYNDYDFPIQREGQLLGAHELNPSALRWERHRVWVVDATLKPGQRHIYSRWTFYIDEDSWQILASVSYDHAGNVYRVGFAYPIQNYSQGEATNFTHAFGIYDLSKGNYQIGYSHSAGNGFYHCSVSLPNLSDFTPQSMAAEAVR